MTDDGVDNEHGVLDCKCGQEFRYTGWNAPETVAWNHLHDDHPEHATGITVTKFCDCGKTYHYGLGCKPPSQGRNDRQSIIQ